jgi:hypothetical protein
MFRKYPKAEPIPEAPVASFPVLDIMLVRAVRCSRIKSMQCRWPSGSSRGDLDVHLGNTATITGK